VYDAWPSTKLMDFRKEPKCKSAVKSRSKITVPKDIKIISKK
jgi:hypothetical protein